MRRGVRSVAALVAALLMVTAGCGGQEATTDDSAVVLETVGPQEQIPSPAPSPTLPAVLAEGFGQRPKPSPSRTTKPPARPKPSRKPPVETELPPPPPPPPPASEECTKPKYVGTQATREQVKAALSDAAGRTYWPVSAPSIQVPLDLVKAVAWQESGWQSNIVACDGGIGLMQVMPDTATWMNQRFDQSYDIDVYTDNAYLGANFLAWLTKWFGDEYFEKDYSLDPDKCVDHGDLCLLNMVISGYNYGHAAVDASIEEDGTLPNPRYVDNVRSLMTGCECLNF